ncbi:hypothetical protein [Burkholderia oklahomensis]|uniref:hypothetical protein n=1 Tax=Burkholderia oklahomensis TaxID=342113 RepID=UPI000F5393DE|nr:hypothetical protein [Burkholderia oklahomensis]MBI0361139.1 hypothetical protein [Burkholderia oklahomensis]
MPGNNIWGGFDAIVGITGGVVAIGEGAEAFERHPAIGTSMIALGGLSILAAILLLITATAGIGFLLGMVVAVIIAAVAIFKANVIRDWLADMVYEIKEKEGREI